MAYTTIDDPTIYFTTKIYTGNNSSQTITGIGFQPDWVWFKSRTTTDSHYLVDSVRGNTKYLRSQTTTAEETNSTAVTSFNSDGYALGSAGNVNDNANYVSWNWKAGTSFTNDASSTGVGTIDSTGSASDTAGFSIVSFVGTGSAGTIKHGLSTAPKLVIIKNLQTAGKDWRVGSTMLGFDKYLSLNQTSASASSSSQFNDTAPTSSVFSVGTNGATNESTKNMIAYVFSERKGYLKIGSYTGNGNADGTFVYTGFKPAWIVLKNVSNAQNWYMYDNKRSDFNLSNDHIYADLNNAETADSSHGIDILSNGFKIRTSNDGWNGSGENYIYMAFAESPFTNSSGVPNNSR